MELLFHQAQESKDRRTILWQEFDDGTKDFPRPACILPHCYSSAIQAQAIQKSTLTFWRLHQWTPLPPSSLHPKLHRCDKVLWLRQYYPVKDILLELYACRRPTPGFTKRHLRLLKRSIDEAKKAHMALGVSTYTLIHLYLKSLSLINLLNKTTFYIVIVSKPFV